MGIFSRPDSPYLWLWLETAPPGEQREKTHILRGTTVTERKDNRALAQAVYHDRMKAIAARVHRLPVAQPQIRFEKYAAAYETDTIAHHAGAGREREILKTLRTGLVDALGVSERLQAIDLDRTKAYMTARRDAGASARTVNREVDLLKAMLRDAVPKYLDASPLVGMKRLRTLKPKRRLMTAAEERRVLAAADDAQDRAILILGVDAMIRLSDLLDLKRTDRHAKGGKKIWLSVLDPKNDTPYDVPLTPRAVRALAAIPDDGPYYFTKFRRAMNERDWPGAVRQRLELLCARAKVPYGKREGGITFHWATRRTGATRRLVKGGQPVTVVQRLGNWKSSRLMLEIYSEAQTDDLLAAVGQPLPRRSRSRRKSA